MRSNSVFGGGAISAVFGVLCFHSQDRLRQREIQRALAGQWSLSNVQRALSQLVGRGLVEMVERGDGGEYRANRGSPAFAPACRIALIESGLGESFGQFHVSAVVAFGSIARGDATSTSDLDILVIGGSVDETQATDAVRPFTERFARRIDVSLIDGFDYNRRRKTNDAFLLGALEEGIVLYGRIPS